MLRNAFVISDIHLGAHNSLLTVIDYHPDTGEAIHRPLAKIILERLIADVRAIAGGERIQQCILLGDIFEFSFAQYGVAMQNGRWFFKALVEADLFDEFVYIPGNHDHHLWQQLSEAHYLMNQLDAPPVKYPRALPPTQLLQDTFLDQLMPEGRRFLVTYPNYAFSIQGRSFYLHHGHYLQKLYLAASQFLEKTVDTKDIDDLEALNAPFLEFGWYNLGQAYNIGKKKLLDRLYFMLKNNDTEELDELIVQLLKKVFKWLTRSQPGARWVTRWILNPLIRMLGPVVMKQVLLRHRSDVVNAVQTASSARHKRLSPEASQPVLNYIQKYMLQGQPFSPDAVFIFGHTHEPEEDVQVQDDQQRTYHLYNTGGWVVDQIDPDGNLVLPQMAPLYLDGSGQIQVVRFTQEHEALLREQLSSDPQFKAIQAQLLAL